ncbi:MAG: DUF2569 domain-containing protein [Pyrinomonadaceae bacterium]|nr:DUF2569 domain-containing protein [Pyrinomonadaceae bacterium]
MKIEAESNYVEADFMRISEKEPGYFLNAGEPAEDGNVYSLCRSSRVSHCWDLIQYSRTDDLNRVKKSTVFEEVEMNDVDRVIYSHIERLGLYVDDHVVIPLGLPTHFPHMRSDEDRSPASKIDREILLDDIEFLRIYGEDALKERVKERLGFALAKDSKTQSSPAPIESGGNDLNGVAGWLMVFIGLQLIRALNSVLGLGDYLKSPPDVYRFVSYSTYGLIFITLIVIVILVLGTRRWVRNLTVSYLAFSFLYSLLFPYLVGKLFGPIPTNEIVSQSIAVLLVGGIYYGAWIMYFLMSKRVKATYS